MDKFTRKKLAKRILTNVGISVGIGLSYYLLYRLDEHLSADPLTESYTLHWTIHNVPLMDFSAGLATCPPLWGHYRFGLSVFLGSFLAVLCGDLFGENPAGVEVGLGHDGWQIWCWMFLFSIIVGIILERRHSKKKRKAEGNL